MTSIASRGMPLARGLTTLRQDLAVCSRGSPVAKGRNFHLTSSNWAVRPYLLADIGEGITECRIVQWFVKPGDKINQFDAVCEVQSNKATVEITSRYDGLVKTLHHGVDEMATVGKALLDIDVEGESEEQSTSPDESTSSDTPDTKPDSLSHPPLIEEHTGSSGLRDEPKTANIYTQAVPAVRLMLKKHGIRLEQVPGTGKNGRVMKEDVQQYLKTQATTKQPTTELHGQAGTSDTSVPLSTVESQMFKVMTNSLSIPHFGYTHSVDFTSLDLIRQKFNAQRDFTDQMLGTPTPKLTFLPIILKALSIAFQKYTKLNSHLLVGQNGEKPELSLKGSHDFGIAVDTPNGLLVPVVRRVQDRSIISIAQEVNRLSEAAKQGSLKPSEVTGATFTVSNIGSIGGNVVSPIIVTPTVGILGIGKLEDVPAFVTDKDGIESIQKQKKAVLSWSADHRVLDGASVARCAELVSVLLKEIDGLSLALI